MLAPARIPVAAGKKMANTEKNVSPRKSGPMFSHIIEADRKKDQRPTVTQQCKSQHEPSDL